ncbi:amino acid adenylation domain-containing protein [Streptomyces sp. TS71-3]|uniref:amino acid adenylation domain-containing protein n=1 Tax=Streptomyces sp. TS71-3 TaxID=2733862 RepID=UPI001B0AB805|nr:amino acid adenylation domain-containing protein [Streptomyces sp. TS71-3]GHJ41525.1 hypothetical protein Sm713_71340 [Streptomyces sp. TS71-3]
MSVSDEVATEISGADHTLGHLLTHAGPATGPARACHSLIRRLPTGTDAAAVRTNLGALAERHPVLRGKVRTFGEALGAEASAPVAHTRRTREACRPLGGSPAVARAVVIGYADGAADLVVVADRRIIGRRALDQLATALTDPAQPVTPPVLVAASEAAAGEGPGEGPGGDPAVLPWGLGDPALGGRTRGLALATTTVAADAPWLPVAATAVVLARYEAAQRAEFRLITAGPEAADTVLSVVLPVEDSMPVADLLDTAARAGVPEREAPPSAPAVGVLVTEGRAGDTYRSVLGPVLPLTLAWEHGADGTLSGVLHYDEGVLDPVIARQFAGHVDRVVEALVHAPDEGRLGDIELVDADEAADIAAIGCSPAEEDAVAAPIHELFRAMASAQPNAPALSDPDRTLSYAELEARSDAVAGVLIGRGVAPGDRVGVCLDRDADLVITLLGVLKAGAAYVPMDVSYPAERLAHTVGDAGVRLVLSSAARFPVLDGVTVLHPAEVLPARWSPSDGGHVPDVGVGADDIAYVIYTSGSTGRPKGVAVPHRNVGALLAATTADLGLGPSDTWTLFHSSAFDFSVWETWGALLTGGHLVVVPYFVSRSPEEFHDLLVRHRVTVLNQTPSAFTGLAEADLRSPAGLQVRLVVFGGEPLDARILRDWFRRHPGTRCRVVNMYGITETTVHVTSQTVTPQDAGTGSRSVGRALPGWSVSVRDTAGRIQPLGVPGEIYVGGAGVASHYLNQKELTAARFVPDPVTGERVYRSGDLGRLRPDGRLDHLGRLDGQVKVRGFRIELGEIRSVLLEDENVTAAAVVLNDDARDPAATRLDAYVVTAGTASAEDIRRRAATYLPDHMVPATFTLLPELPLTVNGKVDTSRLRPAPAAPAAQPGGQAAGDPVLRVWRDVLGGHVGPQDDFFSSGGNSLLAVRLSGALRAAGLPPVTLRDLYVHSTPAEVSALISGRRTATGHAEHAMSRARDGGDPVPVGEPAAGFPAGAGGVHPRPAAVEPVAGTLSGLGIRVRAAWATALGVPAEDIAPDTDFFEIGGTSLRAMQVVAELDGLVTAGDVMLCSRLAELVAAAERSTVTSTGTGGVLVRLTAEIPDPTATVVCLPYAGGSALHFKPVANAVARLDGSLSVAAVELPGHAPGSAAGDLRGIGDTAELITEEIERMVTGPVVLWGHCNGSPLAVEVARLLIERGRMVRHLFLAAMLVPQAEEIRETLRRTESLTFADIRTYVAEWSGDTDLDELGGDLGDLVTRAFRHDALCANGFLLAGLESTARKPLTTPCTVVMASDDPLTAGYESAYRAWRPFVERPELHEIDGGGHYFTRTRPDEVARLMAGAAGPATGHRPA